MTTAATTPGESRSRTASAIILGADAVLAAHPATAVQLAHACLQAGYSTVIPPSWGDELLAAETLRQVRGDQRPVVFCACPHVSARLLGVGDDLAPFLMPLVAPPVAAALYLRELARDEPIEIAFVGACPSGEDASIDTHYHPADFLRTLTDRGISLAGQPDVFDSVLPPDRRRHRSLPGGVPTPEALWSEAGRRALIEITDAEPLTELAQHLASGEPAVLDLGPALGCTCSGAVADVPPRSARSAVCALEPPRSASEIIESLPIVQLSRPISKSAIQGTVAAVPAVVSAIPSAARPDRATPDRATPASEQAEGPATVPTPVAHGADTSEPPAASPPAGPPASTPTPPGRRRAVTTTVRAINGPKPTTHSDEGRALPRAYVGRRQGRRRAGAAPSPAQSQDAAVPSVSPASAPPTLEDKLTSVRNGSTPGRVFASIPIATTSPDVPSPDAPAARVTDESAWATMLPRFEAPVTVLRERARHFARRSAERPVYLGILIAIVALLSIALGMAAGRALGDTNPSTAEPSQHGERPDSMFGRSSASPTADDLPAGRGDLSPNGEPGRRTAGGAAEAPPESSSSRALQQSAAGSVAPPARQRPPARTPQGLPGGARSGTSGRAASVATDSARDSATAAAVVRDTAMRADSVRRDSAARDSARRDSLVQGGDSLRRPVGAPLSGDTILLRQRDELQRELADRQRRIDSLERWLDSVRRTPPPPSPPPR